MIYDLACDFSAALSAMPTEHSWHRILRLLEETIRRDVHFIDRHPTTLFQCMWNSCWWYDSPEAAKHFEEPQGGWMPENAPWLRSGLKLHRLMEEWRRKHSMRPWLRSLRPPLVHLNRPAFRILRDPEPGFDSLITSVAFSPDGNALAAGSADGVVRIWLVGEGTLSRSFRGTKGRVTDAAFSSNSVLLVAGYGNEVRIWNTETGQCLHVLKHPARITTPTFLPDGDRLAVGCENGQLMIWDLDGGSLLREFKCHDKAVDNVACSIKGFMITSGADEVLTIWDVESCRRLHVLPHPFAITKIAVSRDGTKIASRDDEGYVRLWSLHNGEQVLGSKSPTESAILLSFLHGDECLLVFSATGAVCIWHLQEDKWEQIADCSAFLSQSRGLYRYPCDVAISPDFSTVAAGMDGGIVRLICIDREVPLRKLRDPSDAVSRTAVAPQGDHVAALADDQGVWLWSPDGMSRHLFNTYHVQIGFGKDGGRVVTCDSYCESYLAWDITNNKKTEVQKEDFFWSNENEYVLHDSMYENQTCVLRVDREEVIEVTCFPECLFGTSCDLSGRVWAGGTDSHVHVLRLEDLCRADT